MSTINKVTLKSMEGDMFEIDESVAFESQTLQNLIEATRGDMAVPALYVSSKCLAKVIEYCSYHVEAKKISDEKPAVPEAELQEWDAEFIKVDLPTLKEYLMAAAYLHINRLLELTSQSMADLIKGKSALEIRTIFGIESNFTPEEEEEVRQQNKWAFPEGV